ncbi:MULTISPECIES: hypothetical protein [unclassified Streptomyces]|uniref:DUF7848 domain-containing protein n=1 Tax=unclassified Streptomyces TaxID=2593676 RepID=UPI003403287E
MSAPVRRFGFVTMTFRPDRDDDAPPTTYGLRCLTLTDAEIIERPWIMVPGERT